MVADGGGGGATAGLGGGGGATACTGGFSGGADKGDGGGAEINGAGAVDAAGFGVTATGFVGGGGAAGANGFGGAGAGGGAVEETRRGGHWSSGRARHAQTPKRRRRLGELEFDVVIAGRAAGFALDDLADDFLFGLF